MSGQEPSFPRLGAVQFEMAQAHTQPVLRCSRCNKPFDKQTTLKRHGYYCRSRKGDIVPRRSSCTACAKRKARCDHKRPACTGCAARSIECYYPATAPRGTAGRPGHQHAPDKQPSTPPSLTSDSPSSSLDNALSFTDPGDVHLDWDDPQVNYADSDFVNLPPVNDDSDPLSSALSATQVQVSDPMASFLDTLSSPLLQDSTPPTAHTMQLEPLHQQPTPLSPSLPLLGPTLVQRPKPGSGTQRTAGFILHTLKSFPLMMLRHNTLPPFIHPRLMMASSIADSDDLEPLHNCISLLHMLRGRVAGSRKLFWRNVRMECERFLEEHATWNRWGLLAALQALCVYLILRLDEGPSENMDLDTLMVAAVAAIANRAGRAETSAASSNSNSDSHELTWEDWIFEESKRRLCVIYQILNLLVFFEPASMCHLHQSESQLLLAPLPAKKMLWEAADEASWRREWSESDAEEAQVDFGLAANGELVKLLPVQQQGRVVDYCYDPGLAVHVGKQPGDGSGGSLWSVARWDEWCAGMDEFGGLVMLAASMVG